MLFRSAIELEESHDSSTRTLLLQPVPVLLVLEPSDPNNFSQDGQREESRASHWFLQGWDWLRTVRLLSALVSQPHLTGGRCEALAAKGCIVYATARKLSSMDGFTHSNIHKLALDVTKDDNVREVVQAVIAAEGQLDILVNNAGISNSGKLRPL